MNLFLLLSPLFVSSAMAFAPSCSFGVARKHCNTRLYVFGDDHFDMDELRHRISQETAPQLFAVEARLLRPEQVHVILFNPHSHDEGMHTIEYPKGSGNNVILAFEDVQDCNVFSDNLKAQQFHDPTVSSSAYSE